MHLSVRYPIVLCFYNCVFVSRVDHSWWSGWWSLCRRHCWFCDCEIGTETSPWLPLQSSTRCYVIVVTSVLLRIFPVFQKSGVWLIQMLSMYAVCLNLAN